MMPTPLDYRDWEWRGLGDPSHCYELRGHVETSPVFKGSSFEARPVIAYIEIARPGVGASAFGFTVRLVNRRLSAAEWRIFAAAVDSQLVALGYNPPA